MKFLQNILAYGQTYEIAMKNINKRFICNNFTGKFYESMDCSGYQIINSDCKKYFKLFILVMMNLKMHLIYYKLSLSAEKLYN